MLVRTWTICFYLKALVLGSRKELLVRARLSLDKLRAELLADRGSSSHWTGTLSASSLSTATAVSALSIVHRQANVAGQAKADFQEQDSADSLSHLIVRGVQYCVANQNGDGGFGDTDRSYSNIATSMLVAAALRLAKPELRTLDETPEITNLLTQVDTCSQRLDEFIETTGGIEALRRRYGKDKTFVIPILTNCALAGMVSWRQVQALPFELAAVPQSFYRWVRMPVVSYAIPALVAIGQARYFHRKPWFPPLRWLRGRVVERTMDVLEKMQPDSGGYLEATPLTSFVLMSLAATGRSDCQVARKAVDFLRASILEDGAWPIDTNLATWITSLSIHALGCDPRDDMAWADDSLAQWLLDCQHRQRHPFTGAEPGGWGWTDLSGAVPDGDDTPGAILALASLHRSPHVEAKTKSRMEGAASDGVRWLMQLRNRDGGWPTFCRGWGKLPFDRSSTDLTAHALRALSAAAQLGVQPEAFSGWNRAVNRGWRFLGRRQRKDGSILPLWFGNQDNFDDENPIYGTGRVLLASFPTILAGVAGVSQARGESTETSLCTDSIFEPELLIKAADYLVNAQNADGGWGGGGSRTSWLENRKAWGEFGPDGVGERVDSKKNVPIAGQFVTSSVEETAVAVEGLAKFLLAIPDEWRRELASERNLPASGNTSYRSAILRGLEFLCSAIEHDLHRDPWPIGFYFAKLWYHERLYATVFSIAAIGSSLSVFEQSSEYSATEKDPRVVDPHAVRLHSHSTDQPPSKDQPLKGST